MLSVDSKVEPKVERVPLGQVAQLVQVHLSAVALTYQSLSYNFKSDLNKDTTMGGKQGNLNYLIIWIGTLVIWIHRAIQVIRRSGVVDMVN